MGYIAFTQSRSWETCKQHQVGKNCTSQSQTTVINSLHEAQQLTCLLPFQRFHLTRKKVTLLGQVMLQGPGRAQSSWITEAYWAYCWTVAPMFSHWLISEKPRLKYCNWKQYMRQSSPQKKGTTTIYQCGIHIKSEYSKKHVFWMNTYQHSPLPSLPWESTSQWMTPPRRPAFWAVNSTPKLWGHVSLRDTEKKIESPT